MIKTLKDYIDQVQEKFPYFSKDEIESILDYGLRAYVRANKMHCDVVLHNREEEPVVMHCGKHYMSPLRTYILWVNKWRMKERWLWKAKKKKWDGYYYIGLTEEQQKNLKRKGNTITFEKVYPTLIKDELRHLKYVKHIWRVPMISNCGWKFFEEKLVTDNAEYIGENNYEKYHQCFLGRFNHGYAPDVDTSDLTYGCSERVDISTNGE